MLWPFQWSPAQPKPQVLPTSLQCCIGDPILPANTSDKFKTWRDAVSTCSGVEKLCLPSSFPPIPMQGLGLCAHLSPAACKGFWVYQLRESLVSVKEVQVKTGNSISYLVLSSGIRIGMHLLFQAKSWYTSLQTSSTQGTGGVWAM